MAYIDIGDVVSGAFILEGWGDQVRANFLAGVPAIFTAKGDLAVGTALVTAGKLAVGADDSTLVAASGTVTGLAWQTVPAAHVTNATVAALDRLMPGAAWTSAIFDTETADPGVMWAVANPTRLTVPVGGDGWYVIGFNGDAGRTAANAAPWKARILLNVGTELAQAQAVSDRPAPLNLSVCYPLVAGDYLQAQYYPAAVADQYLNVGASFYAIWQRRP